MTEIKKNAILTQVNTTHELLMNLINSYTRNAFLIFQWRRYYAMEPKTGSTKYKKAFDTKIVWTIAYMHTESLGGMGVKKILGGIPP